jgi:hypothetical protein
MPPKKILKRKREQTFLSEYLTNYPWIRATDRDTYARCVYCLADFTIGHEGKFAIKKHEDSKKHKECEQRMKHTTKLSFAMPNPADDLQLKATQAEATMVQLIAECNLPLATADKFNRAFKEMFPDSKIAGKFHCGRSKATCLVKTMGQYAQSDLIKKMKSGVFSISTDGSNDEHSKQFPLVIRTLSEEAETRQVTSELLSVPTVDGCATGEAIFKLIEKVFVENDIPWSNLIAFGCDNANVMVGKNNGVYGHLLRKNAHIALANCTLHLIHIAAEKAANMLPIPVSDILIDIHYYLRKSSKRQTQLQKFQELHGLEARKILKHVCTRWLSIDRCIDRLLAHWDALLDFFKAEEKEKKSEEASTKVKRVVDFLRSPKNKLYCMFLQYAHQAFASILLQMQSEEPQVHKLQRSLLAFLRTLMVKFVKASAFSGCTVDKVQYKVQHNQKKDCEMLIGEGAHTFVQEKEKHKLRDSRVEEFYRNVRKYYITALDYLLLKLPLEDKVLSHAVVADVQRYIGQVDCHNATHLGFLLDKFPALLPPGVSKYQIQEDLALFESEVGDMPLDFTMRMDDVWAQVGSRKDSSGTAPYKALSLVMNAILTVPHSSAHCERIFSCVRKNRTEQRASISDDTLEALLVLKAKSGSRTKFDEKTLKELKSAYTVSLQQQH